MFCGRLPHMSALGNRIRLEREARNWSQQDLADKSGTSQSTIAGLESGRAAATTKIIHIARALRVNPQWLETGTGNKEPSSPSGSYVSADTVEELAEQLVAKGSDDITELWRAILAIKDANREK